MNQIEAAFAEQAIIERAGVLPEVVKLMAKSRCLWHDHVRGVIAVIEDRKIIDEIDTSSFILPDYSKTKYAKYNALRMVANYFGLLADTFLAIERSVWEKEAGK